MDHGVEDIYVVYTSKVETNKALHRNKLILLLKQFVSFSIYIKCLLCKLFGVKVLIKLSNLSHL